MNRYVDPTFVEKLLEIDTCETVPYFPLSIFNAYVRARSNETSDAGTLLLLLALVLSNHYKNSIL